MYSSIRLERPSTSVMNTSLSAKEIDDLFATTKYVDYGLWANVPLELRSIPQWVVWKYEDRTDKDGKTKPTKVPYIAEDFAGHPAHARSNDPSTGRSFDAAVAFYNDNKAHLSGIGIILTEDMGIIGVDLDHSLDNQGAPLDWAQSDVDALDSYTEISPSGKGLRILILGTFEGTGRKVGDREIYKKGRFLTITGNVIQSKALVRSVGDGFSDWFSDRFPVKVSARKEPRPSKPMTEKEFADLMSSDISVAPLTAFDNELISEMRAARNGDKFSALYDGPHSEGSRSNAAMALAAIIAFYTKNDIQIERIMNGSWFGKFYDKWDRPNWRANLISSAIAFQESKPSSSTHAEPQTASPEPQAVQPALLPISDHDLCPTIIQIRNNFFAQKHIVRYNLSLKEKKLLTSYMAINTTLRSCVGKLLAVNNGFARTYCGSTCFIAVDESGDGKTEHYNYCSALSDICIGDQKNKITGKITIDLLLESMLARYCMKEKNAGRYTWPAEDVIRAKCIASNRGCFCPQDEVGPVLKQMFGGWSGGSDDSSALFMQLLNDAGPDPIGKGGRTMGKVMVYDPCLSFMGFTNPKQITDSIDPMSEKSRKDGLLARLGILIENVSAFDYDSADLSVTRKVEDCFKNVTSLIANDKRIVVEAPDAIAFESLDFGMHNNVRDAFLENATIVKSIKNKVARQAIGDAMLWALLESNDIKAIPNEDFIEDHPLPNLDIAPYYQRCLKVRFAMFVNAFNTLCGYMDETTTEKVIGWLKTHPGKHLASNVKTEMAKNSKPGFYQIVNEAIDCLIGEEAIAFEKKGKATWIWYKEKKQ